MHQTNSGAPSAGQGESGLQSCFAAGFEIMATIIRRNWRIGANRCGSSSSMKTHAGHPFLGSPEVLFPLIS
jgi:hypothetical protein